MDEPTVANERSFEASLERIREIVSELESGNLTLDQAITTYREGATLIENARKLIADAELRIRELSADDVPNG